MADPAPATPAEPVVPAVPATPAEPAAPVGNLVADSVTPATAAPAAPALAVAPVDPAVARAYLTEHGMKAEDVAKIADADLGKQYDAAKAAEAAKPIEYKEFKVPEGFKFDDATLAGIKTDFAEARLSQDQAQKLIDKHVAAVKSAAESPYVLWNKTQAEWQKEVMSDPTIGGANYETVTKPAIAKAISTFGGDATQQAALREAMNFTGAGNNPHIVRFMARLGASLQEGGIVSGGKPAANTTKTFEDMATKMYPSQGQSK